VFRTLSVVVLLALVGCPGTKTVTAPAGGTKNDNDNDNNGAPNRVREVEATVLENYRLFANGSSASYAQGIARDRAVAIAGITPNLVLVGEWPDGIEDDRRPYQARAVRIVSKNLDVHIAENPSVAWVSDELSYRVPYKGREASVPIRFTGVYVRDIDRWLVVMEHMSYALPMSSILDKAQRNELSILPPIPKQEGEGASKSADQIKKIIKAKLDRWHKPGTPVSDLVAADTDVLVMWPDADAEYRGLAASAAPKLSEGFGDKATLVSSQYRVFVGGSQTVAWAIANHTVRLDTKKTVDMRATYVLEQRGRTDKWTIVQAHASVPLHIRQIDQRVFGLRRRKP